MIPDDEEKLRTMLAAYARMKTRIAETDVCLSSAWRMLDSSKLTVAQCKRTLSQHKRAG